MYVLTAAPGPLVTLEEARLQVRIYATGSPPTHPDDSRIERLIQAQTEYVDGPYGVLNRALLTQGWSLIEDKFPPGSVPLPILVSPVTAIGSIRFTDAEGNAAAMDPATYKLDNGMVVPTTAWPTTLAGTTVTVAFTAGMAADPADIPAMVKEAVLLRIEAHYDLDANSQATLLDRSADMLENVKAGGGGVG
jgi:uncharacterized phiE125 gp8 family phage protein